MRCGDSAFFAVSARCFRAECAEIPRAASAKLHKMQFLCIAKRVTVNNVNSNISHRMSGKNFILS